MSVKKELMKLSKGEAVGKLLFAYETINNMEKKITDVQQLKAEIAACADQLELIKGTGFMVGKRVDVLAKMRQLSAV